MCVYTYIYIHMYIYTSIHVYLCIYPSVYSPAWPCAISLVTPRGRPCVQG